MKKSRDNQNSFPLPRATAIVLAATSVVLFNACVEPLKMDSLLDDQEDLCASDAAFQAAVARCQQQEGCGGVASFRGSLQFRGALDATAVAATDESIHSSALKIVRYTDGDTVIMEVVDLFTVDIHSDYGDYTFEFKDLDQFPPGGDSLSMVSAGVATGIERASDGLLRASLRINNGTESVNIRALPDSGFLILDEIHTGLVRGRFEMAFENPEDILAGCFEFYPADISIEREDISQE